jgi:hypothetical protein
MALTATSSAWMSVWVSDGGWRWSDSRNSRSYSLVTATRASASDMPSRYET